MFFSLQVFGHQRLGHRAVRGLRPAGRRRGGGGGGGGLLGPRGQPERQRTTLGGTAYGHGPWDRKHG